MNFKKTSKKNINYKLELSAFCQKMFQEEFLAQDPIFALCVIYGSK